MKKLESQNSLNFNSSLKELRTKEVDKEGIEIIYLEKLDSRQRNLSKNQNDYVPKLEALISLRYYKVFV